MLIKSRLSIIILFSIWCRYFRLDYRVGWKFLMHFKIQVIIVWECSLYRNVSYDQKFRLGELKKYFQKLLIYSSYIPSKLQKNINSRWMLQTIYFVRSTAILSRSVCVNSMRSLLIGIIHSLTFNNKIEPLSFNL